MSAEVPPLSAAERMQRLPVVPVLAALLLAAGAVVGMSDVLTWVASAWYSFFGVGVYSHGYLVLAVAIWMGWTFWRRDPPTHLAPNWWAAVPLVLLSFALIGMEMLYIGSARALLLPLFFLAATVLVFGLPAARRLLVPALFVYFGLLPWYLLNQPLQLLVTRIVEGLMATFNDIPVYIEATTIHLPAGVIEVVSSCSGLSFLLSASVIAVFYSACYLRDWKHRIILVLTAAAAALVSNWIRIWTLVLIGHYSGLQHWLVDDHYLYGWVLFVIALVPVLFLARRMELREIRDDASDSASQPSTSGALSARTTHMASAPASSPALISASAMLPAAIAGALIMALPAMATTGTATVVNTEPLRLPQQLTRAVLLDESPDWRPSFTNARMGSGAYAFGDARVEVFVAVYPQQAREHHLYIRGNAFVGERLRDVPGAVRRAGIDGEAVRVIEYPDRTGFREAIVWAWYEIGDRPVTSRLGVKLLEIPSLLRGDSSGAAFAVRAECSDGCDRARELLEDFLGAAGGDLRAVVRRGD
jgi:EpsI family protein